MLITETYRALNRQLHAKEPTYGISGSRYVDLVKPLSEVMQTRDILDYGCGKRTLERDLGFAIANYDPAIKGCEGTPSPADLVVCTDVLEHVEPDLLGNVLADLARVTKREIIISVSLVPAKKSLADGRNAHLIVESSDWWVEKLNKVFIGQRWFLTLGEANLVFIGRSWSEEGEEPEDRRKVLEGLGPVAQVKTVVNKSVYTDEQRCANIRSTMLRCLPTVTPLKPHKNTMVLVCSGPSLMETMDELRKETGDIWTVSGAHSLLIENGIIPKAHVESDPKPIVAQRLGAPHKAVSYFLASSCDRALFNLLHGHEVFTFHVTASAAESQLIASMDRKAFTIDGGTNVGMSALGLGSCIGYRDFVIYGLDCSFKASDEVINWDPTKELPDDIRERINFHARLQPDERQQTIRVRVGDRPFITSPQMLQCVQDFVNIRLWGGHTFRLRGDGFLKNFIVHAETYPNGEQRSAASVHRLRPTPARSVPSTGQLDYQSRFKARLGNPPRPVHPAPEKTGTD